MSRATITVGIDPFIDLGPVTLAWHGLTIAIGILLGAWVAARVAEQFGMPAEPMTTVALLAGAGGLIGGRLLYLAEHGHLLEPARWLGTQKTAILSPHVSEWYAGELPTQRCSSRGEGHLCLLERRAHDVTSALTARQPPPRPMSVDGASNNRERPETRMPAERSRAAACRAQPVEQPAG